MRSRHPHRVRSIFIGLLILFVAALGVVCFRANTWVRDYINRSFVNLPDYTGRVERVRLHPWNASVDVYDFHIDKKTGQVSVPFFYSPRWHVSLQWSQILHGVKRASVIIYQPRFNIVAGPSDESRQLGISGVWIDAIKTLIPWRVNQLRVHDGELHFIDEHADPKIDLKVDQIEFAAENLSNSKKLKIALPATVKLTARPLQTGYAEMNLAVNLDERYATFTQSFRLEHIPATAANTALQKYLKARVKSGEIGLYSELSSDKGVYQGYVKPFFSHLEFEPKPSDKDNPGAVWSATLNTVKGLFENDKKVIATQTPISGRVDQPKIAVLAAIGGILWNAYIEALRPGFDQALTPPTPTDTVTTPKSDTTKKEAAQASPAAKENTPKLQQK